MFETPGDVVCQPTDTYRDQAQRAVSKDAMITTPIRSHLEVAFEVWEHGQSWFWLVVSPHSERGTVGAAATEADAIRDARSLIENRWE